MNHDFKYNTFTYLMAVACLFCGFFAMAKVDSEDSGPTAENNIICYAAKSKWVCAPANQKEKAQQKVKTLILEEQTSADVEPTEGFRDGVEIKTIKYDDIAGQVKEVSIDDTTDKSAIGIVAKEQSVIKNDVVNTITSAVETTKPTPDTVNLNNDFTDWQNNHPNQWSFQVVGTSNRHKLDAFFSENGLQANACVVVKTQVNNADWWVVLCGLYANRDEAINSRHLLPEKISTNAWVRQIKTIDGVAD